MTAYVLLVRCLIVCIGVMENSIEQIMRDGIDQTNCFNWWIIPLAFGIAVVVYLLNEWFMRRLK